MAPDDAPGRLLAMLQPLRQLESNWSVDIAGELSSYYEELSCLDFEVDGITGLDFTDAALVVYHSSCTYSKKVEHLMKLTMSALESAKVKRKAKKGNSRDNKTDEDSILAGHHWSKKVKRIRTLVKGRDAFSVLADAEAAPPVLKEALRVDHFPTVGDTVASETAQSASASAAQGPTDAPTFNTMRSHNHISGAQLLLQQSGTLFDTNLNMFGVGAYARPSDLNRRQPLHLQPGTAAPAADQPVDGFGSPVGEDDPAPPPDDMGDLWCGDDGGGDYGWGEAPPSPPAGPMDANDMPPAPVEHAAAMDADAQPAAADVAADGDGWDEEEEEEEDEGLGVWEPLDPHEKTPGGKPFKQQIPKIPKLKTTLKQQTWQCFLIPEPFEAARTRNDWIRSVQVNAAPEPPKRTKKNRAPVATLAPGPALEETDPPELHADDEQPAPLDAMDLQAGAPDDAEWPAGEWPVDDSPDDAGGDDFVFDDAGDDQHLDPVFPGMEGVGAEEVMHMAGSQYEVRQAAPSGALAYEELVAQYSQAVAEASAAALAQSSLSKMVSSWRENITSVMNEQDRRPAFDIQKTGQELVARAGMLYKQKDVGLRFGEIIDCEYPYEVARNFSAFLQQVNEGKMLLERGENPAEPFYVSVPA